MRHENDNSVMYHESWLIPAGYGPDGE